MPSFGVTIQFEAPNLDAALEAIGKVHGQMAKAKLSPQVSEVRPIDGGRVFIYTDGGCDKNGSRYAVGSWAYRVEHGEMVREESGAFMGTTNNRMEMMAVILALESLEFGLPVRVVSDSQYVIKGCTEWARNWIRRGWLNYEGKPVKNRDLWERLLALYQLHDCSFEHVRGHRGHPQNERVDELCTIAIINANKLLIDGESIPVDEGSARYQDEA